jgi:hypothetical protein
MVEALGTVQTRGRGLVRRWCWPVDPTLVFDQMAAPVPEIMDIHNIPSIIDGARWGSDQVTQAGAWQVVARNHSWGKAQAERNLKRKMVSLCATVGSGQVIGASSFQQSTNLSSLTSGSSFQNSFSRNYRHCPLDSATLCCSNWQQYIRTHYKKTVTVSSLCLSRRTEVILQGEDKVVEFSQITRVIWSLAGEWDSSISHSIQTSSGTHPAYYTSTGAGI